DGHAIARAARGGREVDGTRDGRSARTPDGDLSRAPENQPAGKPDRKADSIAVPRPALDDVLGWQRVSLAKNAVCGRCNEILPRGSEAAIGIAAIAGDGASPPLVICIACFDEVRA